MCVGPDTYIARMLALLNWQTVPVAPKQRYPEVDPADGFLSDCELVLASSEPFPFKASHIDELREAIGMPDLPGLLVDGEMLSWYGSRAIAGLAYLRDLQARVQAL